MEKELSQKVQLDYYQKLVDYYETQYNLCSDTLNQISDILNSSVNLSDPGQSIGSDVVLNLYSILVNSAKLQLQNADKFNNNLSELGEFLGV
jgi:hypothetical protein